jgi:hypothetical protein
LSISSADCRCNSRDRREFHGNSNFWRTKPSTNGDDATAFWLWHFGNIPISWAISCDVFITAWSGILRYHPVNSEKILMMMKDWRQLKDKDLAPSRWQEGDL